MGGGEVLSVVGGGVAIRMRLTSNDVLKPTVALETWHSLLPMILDSKLWQLLSSLLYFGFIVELIQLASVLLSLISVSERCLALDHVGIDTTRSKKQYWPMNETTSNLLFVCAVLMMIMIPSDGDSTLVDHKGTRTNQNSSTVNTKYIWFSTMYKE